MRFPAALAAVALASAATSSNAFTISPAKLPLSNQNALSGGAFGPLFLQGRGEYYGESDSSLVVKEFSSYDQLEEIVELTSRALPERPDGIVCVAKFTSSTNPACVKTEAQYERLARGNPATCFLRCFREFEAADILLGQAQISVLPTFDIFYGGTRVARIEGNRYPEVESLIERYQFQNSKLDLFSEDADNKRRLAWGNGQIPDAMSTPRTTGRFVPGYDWDKDKGAFDDAADKAQDDWDKAYGDWVPDISDK